MLIRCDTISLFSPKIWIFKIKVVSLQPIMKMKPEDIFPEYVIEAIRNSKPITYKEIVAINRAKREAEKKKADSKKGH